MWMPRKPMTVVFTIVPQAGEGRVGAGHVAFIGQTLSRLNRCLIQIENVRRDVIFGKLFRRLSVNFRVKMATKHPLNRIKNKASGFFSPDVKKFDFIHAIIFTKSDIQIKPNYEVLAYLHQFLASLRIFSTLARFPATTNRFF